MAAMTHCLPARPLPLRAMRSLGCNGPLRRLNEEWRR